MAIFPGGPGLAGTTMSLILILLEIRMTEVVVTTEAVRRAKLQSNHHQQAVRVATDMPPPLSSPVGAPAPCAPPSRHNVAVLSHAEYVPTLTAAPASRVNASVSKAAWWCWPWKWCRDTCATSVPILVFLGLSVLDLGPMYATDRCQTASSLNAAAY